MPNGVQVVNGKAFEFAIGSVFAEYLTGYGQVEFVASKDLESCKNDFELQSESSKLAFSHAAKLPVETLCRLEPGLTHPTYVGDKLYIKFMPDSAGQYGDVRDVVFYRLNKRGALCWEIGISAKNNHEAVKHPRVSPMINFGDDWGLGISCSDDYMAVVAEVFNWVAMQKTAGKTLWRELGAEKHGKVYKPLMDAFCSEMTRFFEEDPSGVAQRLIRYLIGVKPFYKVIKHDRYNVVVVKAFNFIEGLNEKYNHVAPQYVPDKIPLPTRMVELNQKGGSVDTLSMIMDGGWQVDFRFHNAESKLMNSVKLDVQLKGNPPVLFTQHLF